MGKKYCPECKEVVYAKALANYSHVEFRDIPYRSKLLWAGYHILLGLSGVF